MKKFLSVLFAAVTAFGITAVTPNGFADISVTASAELADTADGTKYKNDDGTYAKSQFVTEGENTYYFDKNGIMKTGWLKMKSGKKYYFKKDGTMATGWLKIGDKQYHFDKKGVMTTGDAKIGKKIYYFNDDGSLGGYYKGINGLLNGKVYCIGDDGYLLYGIQKVDYTDGTYNYYYFGKNGYAISHEEVLDGITYVFDEEQGLIDSYIKVYTQSDFGSVPVTITDFEAKCSAVPNALGNYKVTYSGYVKNTGYNYSTLPSAKNNTPLKIRIYMNFEDANGNIVKSNKLIAWCSLRSGETYAVSDTVWVSSPVSYILLSDLDIQGL